MKHWFKDQHFRSLLKNSSYLAASRVIAAIAAVATLSLAAHALGVVMLGALILITSYAKAASGISKFQSWQLIVRYGGRALHGEIDDFKTSTGFAKGGATVADIALMRRVVGPELGVKASGGVKSMADARAMVEAGATRIGASVGVKIAQEAAGIRSNGGIAARY